MVDYFMYAWCGVIGLWVVIAIVYGILVIPYLFIKEDQCDDEN